MNNIETGDLIHTVSDVSLYKNHLKIQNEFIELPECVKNGNDALVVIGEHIWVNGYLYHDEKFIKTNRISGDVLISNKPFIVIGIIVILFLATFLGLTFIIDLIR